MVAQFLNGRRQGPIGMSEEKDAAQAAREMAETEGELAGLPPLKPQLGTSPGLGERAAVGRRRERVMGMLPTLSRAAQDAIYASYMSDPAPVDMAWTRPLPRVGNGR